MDRRPPSGGRSTRGAHVAGVVVAVLAIAGLAGWAGGDTGTRPVDDAPLLPAVTAVPVTTDTLFVGGFARGTFTEALGVLASDLSAAEREMVGRHLDKIYAPLLEAKGLAGGGRLRVAYERTRRPSGATRSIQVLAAEAAVGGSRHTVFLYEDEAHPGYFDDLGRSLDAGSWATPLQRMQVTSGFRMDRMHPILRRVLPHTGVDLAAGMGTPVYATGDGSVSYAAVRGGYGRLVEIQHPNGYATRYAHLSRIAPGIGPWTPVRQGQVIGYVGQSGLATGPHLHYEVRRKGQPVDPSLVQVSTGPSQHVGYERGWRDQRRQLARLLARAPTVVSARAD